MLSDRQFGSRQNNPTSLAAVCALTLCWLVAGCADRVRLDRSADDAGPETGTGGGGADGGVVILRPSAAGAGGEAGATDDPCAGDAPPLWCGAAECGDGIISGEERCDDGNADDGDGCSSACDAVETDYVCRVPGEPCTYTVECGDGVLTGQEQCDDGNIQVGDGCADDCQLESGWACPQPGRPCLASACGDGELVGNEECEDGNASSGDGCSGTCRVESGFVCPTLNVACRPTVCGDGVVEGDEGCDDGDAVSGLDYDLGDGCTPLCQREPDCSQGACVSTCGDGLILPGDAEECDDGNTTSGDGCSSTCAREEGYDCETITEGDTGQLDLPIVLRDFIRFDETGGHPDFQQYNGEESGIVAAELDPVERKPVYADPYGTGTTDRTTSAADFDQWYRDDPKNVTELQTLTLLEDVLQPGTFVFYDPTFFPLTDRGWVALGNESQYTDPDESLDRNYFFTSEVRYWFEYQGGEFLEFKGDDDVWVFVNGQLAVDLGGVHGELTGGVTLDAAAAATFGLEVGQVYEIVVFQAERHLWRSGYQLTLSGFNMARTECTNICGDGIVTSGEVCDDGEFNGQYGYCSANCDGLGPHCGDGVIQDASGEECDNGINLSTYEGCGPGCVLAPYCGDGNVDSLFGEVCDDGENDGGYGECESGCRRGARCGDGVVQESNGEACDDGNTRNGDGCNAVCALEIIE